MSSPQAPAMYEVRDLQTGGKGLFATQDIPPGTLVLSDRMLLRLETAYFHPQPTSFSEKARNKVISRARTRTRAQFAIIQQHCRRVLGQLAVDEITQESLLDGNNRAKKSLIDALKLGGMQITRRFIFNDNSPAMTVRSYDFYEDLHALRQGCNPNAHRSMRRNMKTIDVRAIKAIKEGEEITFCTDNPFRPREKRQEFVCGSPCNCVVCTADPGESLLNEQLYKGLDRRFEKLRKFRARFFQDDEIVDFSDRERRQELAKKADQIYALEREKILRVLKDCRWIEEQKVKFGLMHGCFADVYEMMHIMWRAYVVKYGREETWEDDGEEGSRPLQMGGQRVHGNDRDDDEDDDLDDGSASERGVNVGDGEEGPDGTSNEDRQREGMVASVSLVGGNFESEAAKEGEGGKSQDVEAAESDRDEAEAEDDNEPPSPADQALVKAWVFKLKKLDVYLVCYGFEHEASQHVLQQAWSLSLSHSGGDWKQELKHRAREYGYQLVDRGDWWFDVAQLEESDEEGGDNEEGAEEVEEAGVDGDGNEDGGLEGITEEAEGLKLEAGGIAGNDFD